MISDAEAAVEQQRSRKSIRRAREREAGLRKPLIYASARSLEESRRLMPGRVVECEVERLVLAGRVREPRGAEAVAVELDGGLMALVKRDRRPNGRRCWVVVAVKKGSQNKEVHRGDR
jgi:hypothetical protein